MHQKEANLLVILYPVAGPPQHYVEVIDSKDLIFLAPCEVRLHYGMMWKCSSEYLTKVKTQPAQMLYCNVRQCTEAEVTLM